MTGERMSSARSERRARRALRWYPKAWRQRYGDEFSALLADTVEGGGGGIRLRWDVARGGLVARAEGTGLVGEAAEVERRTRSGALTAFWAASIFLLALGFASALATNWRNYPLDEQAEQYGEHYVGAGSSDWAPWMHGARGIPIVAADAIRVGAWAIGLALLAGVVTIVALWILQAPNGGGWHRWARPIVAVAVPSACYAGSRLVAHFSRTWLFQVQHDRWMYRFLGVTWNAWSLWIFYALSVAGATFALFALVDLARGARFGVRANRFLRRLAAVVTALMVITGAAAAVWVAGLYGQAPDVLWDRLPANAPSVGAVGGRGGSPVGFGRVAIGLFGTPWALTMLTVGGVLSVGLVLAILGARRAASRPRPQLT